MILLDRMDLQLFAEEKTEKATPKRDGKPGKEVRYFGA